MLVSHVFFPSFCENAIIICIKDLEEGKDLHGNTNYAGFFELSIYKKTGVILSFEHKTDTKI